MLVQAWQASDGSIHKTEEEYLQYEQELKIEKEFSQLYTQYGYWGKVEITEQEELKEIVQTFPELFQYWIDTKGE